MKLLDSDICVALMRNNIAAVERLAQHEPGQIFVPTIVQAELYAGVYLGAKPEKTRREVERLLSNLGEIGFSSSAARRYGEIRVDLQKRGLMIGSNDLIIASIALAEGYTLVTHNTREFSRVPGLRLEDWLT